MKSRWLLLGLLLGFVAAGRAVAQNPFEAAVRAQTSLRVPLEPEPADRTPSGKADKPLTPAQLAAHPLTPALRYATEVSGYVKRHVRDYTCVLAKHERLEGELQDVQYIRAAVRAPRIADGQVTPLSVFLEFLGPAKLKGRRVLYIAGQNDDKLLVRNGGSRFNYMTVKLNPRSDAAMRESLVPITDIGFEHMLGTLVRLIGDNMRRDPTAANTKVLFYKHAKVNDRSCTRIALLHPQPDTRLEFAEADVYVDDELHVPIRIEGYLWPEHPGDDKQLLFEYTYEDLQLNVGLNAADFRPSQLEVQPAR